MSEEGGSSSSSEEDVQVVEDVPQIKSSSHIMYNPKVGPVDFRMKPSLENVFKTRPIKTLIRATLLKTLQGRKYNSEDARTWIQNIADSVSVAVKELSMPRFKHIVEVKLGQQLGGGCRYISRCSWDIDSDSQTSEVFNSPSMFCICTVFGVYVY